MATSTSALARRAALGPRGAAAPARVLIPTSRSVDEGHAQAQVYTSSARNATWKFHPGAEKGEQSSNFSSSCTFLWVHGGSRLLCGPRPSPKRGRGFFGWGRASAWRPPAHRPLLGPVGPVGLDLLLANLLGDLSVLADLVLREAHALLRHGLLLDHRLLLVEHHLVLLLGDGRAVGRRSGVGVGDRLALDADLLALHRNRLGDVLGDHVLAQPDPAGLPPLGVHPQLLLGAGHRVVGGGATHVVALRAGLALRQPGVGARLRVVQPVVAVQRRFFLLGELAVGLSAG